MTSDNDLIDTESKETCSIPSELGLVWREGSQTSLEQYEGNILKSELIIPSDSDVYLPRTCRLCSGDGDVWFPFYKCDGSLAVESKHLDMIRILASIEITHELDHSSVLCSFCLVKIEEFAILRDIWRRNDSVSEQYSIKSSLEPTGQAVSADSSNVVQEVTQVEVEEQSKDESVAIDDDSDDADVQSKDESIVIDDESDDSDVQIVSSSTLPVVEEVNKRVTRSEKRKSELIHQAIRLVRQQFTKSKKRNLLRKKSRRNM